VAQDRPKKKTYFLANSRYLIPAFFISLLVALAYFASLGFAGTIGGLFMALWLTIWTGRRLRTGPRRFDCLEGSPSWAAIPRL